MKLPLLSGMTAESVVRALGWTCGECGTVRMCVEECDMVARDKK